MKDSRKKPRKDADNEYIKSKKKDKNKALDLRIKRKRKNDERNQ